MRSTTFYVNNRPYTVYDNGDVYRQEYTVTMKNRWGNYMQVKKPAKKLAKRLAGHGYVRYSIQNKDYTGHRLVAQHFIPNPHNKPWVNHKDCNKENNHFSNLEWVTAKENTAHANENGLIRNGEKHTNATLSNKQVLEIVRLFNTGQWTRKQLSEKFRVSRKGVIERILRGERWTKITGIENVKNKEQKK